VYIVQPKISDDTIIDFAVKYNANRESSGIKQQPRHPN